MAKDIHLIVGLGNPGKKYENTRHNVGASVIEKLEFLNLANVILAKPTTFMNESGKAVKSLTKNRRILAKNLIIIHDDIDLPIGAIKISFDAGSAGHKGVESIINSLGTKNFTRLRIGIQPKAGKLEDVENFVLKKFTKGEAKIVDEAINKSSQAIQVILRDGLEKAMNEFNK